MRLYILAAAAIASLGSMNSCNKKVEAFCTNEYFGEVFLTDPQGNATSTFTVGEDLTFNMNFTNNSGDSLMVNYTNPWVEYEIMSGVNLVATTSPVIPETGLNTAGLANGEVILDMYDFNTTLPVGKYTLKARCYYEIMGCDNGLRITEKTTEFSVVQ